MVGHVAPQHFTWFLPQTSGPRGATQSQKNQDFHRISRPIIHPIFDGIESSSAQCQAIRPLKELPLRHDPVWLAVLVGPTFTGVLNVHASAGTLSMLSTVAKHFES